jgi:hypothetical protein
MPYAASQIQPRIKQRDHETRPSRADAASIPRPTAVGHRRRYAQKSGQNLSADHFHNLIRREASPLRRNRQEGFMASTISYPIPNFATLWQFLSARNPRALLRQRARREQDSFNSIRFFNKE